jgi:ABC-type multidrug transport system ATPase subunit
MTEKMQMAEDIIKVSNLSRSYGKNKAVDNLSFSVKAGSVHGFLGPNGAGKTTVIKILLGLIMPDKGGIEIFGMNLFGNHIRIMKQIGAVVESPVFFEYFSAYENLYYLSKFSGGCAREQILNALSIVGLEDASDKMAGTFSYGMKQRLGIAQSLLPENKLIFLDEPMNGLDPHGIAGVRKLIKRLSKDYGVTVFISSHLLAEVEQVCDFVTIIQRGRLVHESSVSKLISERPRVELITDEKDLFANFAKDKKIEIIALEGYDGKFKFVINAAEDEIPALARDLCKAQISIYKIANLTDSLEDIFVELTGKNERDSLSDRF